MTTPVRLPSRITMRHHPEALFDEAYRTVEQDLASYRPIAGPWRAEADDNGLCLRGGGGATIRAGACAPGVLRIRSAPGGEPAVSATERLGLVTVAREPVRVEPAVTRSSARLRAGALSFACDLSRGDFAVSADGGGPLVETLGGGWRFSSEAPEFGGHRYVGFFRLGDERVYGFGGRIHRPDRTGQVADMFAVKAGRHSGDYGGCPVPFFLSTRGYGVFLNNPWPHVYFDMGRTDPAQWFVHAPGGDCDLFVIHGPEFGDILRRFTALTGRIPPPRRWWLGVWNGSLSISTTKEVIEVAERFRAEGLPCEAIQIDGNWRGGPEFMRSYMVDGAYTSHDLEWHPEFGDGPAMVRRLRDLHMRTVLHINSRCWGAETTARGLAEGWLRREGHEIVVRVGDPAAERRYEEHLQRRNREGIGAWLLDHGDRLSGEALPGIPSRNLYGALWARAVARTCPAQGDPSPITFIRGCCIGGQRNGIPWSGDTRFGVDFFAEDVWYLLNAGLAGFALASCDLGGFYGADPYAGPHNTAYDPDNLARRLCQSLFFMPTPRTQDDGKEPPKFPWNCPEPVRSLYGRMLKLRYRMVPYLFSCLVKAHLTGEPLLRPLVYHHRDDPVTHTMFDEFYLGEWLLVAPVLEKGATSRAVYLPRGRWVDFWRGTRIRGPATVRVPAPLYELQGLPVFVKAGAILPSQPDTDHLPDEPPREITLDLFPDGETAFDLHDSATARTVLGCRRDRKGVHIRVANGIPRKRKFRILLHGVDDGVPVTLNGRRLALRDRGGVREGRVEVPALARPKKG